MLNASHPSVPAARTENLVITLGSDEVQVYDEKIQSIHRLNATATRVWFLCDGNKSVRDIALEARLPENVVLICLPCLADAHLLISPLSLDLRTRPHRRTFPWKSSGSSTLPEIVTRFAIAES